MNFHNLLLFGEIDKGAHEGRWYVMAIYLKAIKIIETTDKVTYRYGGHPQSLTGQFSIMKDLSNWELELDVGIPVSGLIGKICNSYMGSSIFPDEMTYQA